jgi:tetratricopeptide (TPR) repeat protein
MHELLRQYAAEKLVNTPDAGNTVRDLHARFYIDALHHWAGASKRPDQLKVLAKIEADLDNIRAAWDWAITKKDVTWLTSGLDGFCIYLQWRGYFSEGEIVCQKTVKCLLDNTSDGVGEKYPSTHKIQGMRGLVLAWTWYGYYAYTQGKIDLANDRFKQGMNIIENSPDHSDVLSVEHAFLLRGMAEPALDTNLDYAEQVAQQSLSLYKVADDPWGEARALYLLAHTAWRYGQIEKSTQLTEQGLAIFRRLGDRREIAWGLVSFAMIDTNQGKPERAEQNSRKGLKIAREIGDANLIAMSRTILCCALSDQGRFIEAKQHREQNLNFQRERGNTHAVMGCMVFLGMTIIHLGEYDKAKHLAEKAIALCDEYNNYRNLGDAYQLTGRIALTEENYTQAQEYLEKSLSLHLDFGAKMSCASTLSGLAIAEQESGNKMTALRHLYEALSIAKQSKNRNIALHAITAYSKILLGEGEGDKALEYYALVSQYPFVANSRWFEDIAGSYITSTADKLSPKLETSDQVRTLWSEVGKLLAELSEQVPVNLPDL